jgi:1-phosphofructokinase family hexose kinase
MPQTRIVTVTLNPAVDRVLEVPRFRVGQHTKGRRIGWYPAGKGINVSRVLATLGIRSVATGLVGRNELAMFEEYLERVGGGLITTQLLVVRGRTRDNVTIVDPIDETETHVRDEGVTVARDDARRIMSKVAMLAREDVIVCFSGSLPPGVTTGDLRTMLHRCAETGARAVVDTSAAVLPVLRDERIWMVKVNAAELEALAGMPTQTQDQTLAAARSLVQRGRVTWVIATRGADGAVFVGEGVERVARSDVHPGLVVNTVGCGDAMLAGVLSRVVEGEGWNSALRWGVGAATANAISRAPGSLTLLDAEEYAETAMLDEAAAVSG